MLQKLDLVAPRAGRIDSIPYKLGDQAPVGAPLVVMLVGDAPHARVYVPEPLRAGVAVGQRARVCVGADDGEQVFEGTVRKNGRASYRERECQYVPVSVVCVTLNTK